MSRLYPAALITAAFSLLLACCGGTDVKTGIVGEWKGETVKQDFHFFSDGRVELNDLQHSTYKGIWEISDGNVLTCRFDSPIFTEPVVMKAEISGDRLTLKADSGRKEVYVRK